jgi:hypothetical protein
VIAFTPNVDGFVQPGLIRGACRRKLVNFILKPIYGGTGIKASQSFQNDPRVAHKPLCCAWTFDPAQGIFAIISSVVS